MIKCAEGDGSVIIEVEGLGDDAHLRVSVAKLSVMIG